MRDRPPPAGPDDYPAPRVAWYLVGVLTVAYIFSFIDRQILALLVGPVRRDLGISDTTMSLLLGTSFAVFYTFFGIPLGRLADRASRRALAAAGFAFWSLATAASGFARTFRDLLLCRIGVGVGEAALNPAAYSLIADSFPPERRSTALSVYGLGIYLGGGLASILGGVVVDLVSTHGDIVTPLLGTIRPWQVVFFSIGIPGLLLAPLLLTVGEPLRKGAGAAAPAVPLGEALRYLWANRATIASHNFGIALLSLSGYAAGAWVPTLLIRVHGWSAARAGTVFGLVTAVLGAAGVLAGGRLAGWLAARGFRDANLRVAVISAALWLPSGLLFSLMPSGGLVMALYAVTQPIVSLPFGAAPAAIAEIMPNRLRGQASAIYVFIINLIGLGLGPTSVALVGDYLLHDERALGVSLAVVGGIAHLAALAILWAGLRPFRESRDRLAAAA